MVQGILNSTTVPLLEQVVRFTEMRQKLLVGNVANIDTPGYKSRDLPVEKFQQALRDALAGRETQQATTGLLSSGSPSSQSQQSRSIDRFFPRELFEASEDNAQNITFQDGNNRSIERAMMEMRKNAAKQRFAIEVISSQLNMLQTVISERP
jgi:flagellar basal-body rod protein FlgB